MTFDLEDYAQVTAPRETNRLVPARFPPLPDFDRVATPEDLAAVMELKGWTDDRLSSPRLSQIDRDEWVFGRPNASVVMAAFLHGSPTGLRFSGPELGAWYASTELTTAVLEVANGMRREIAQSAVDRLRGTYRRFTARLGGVYLDIFGRHPEIQGTDETAYAAGQALGRQVRDAGRGRGLSGLRYESVRHAGHANWVCYRPREVMDVLALAHFELDVPPEGRVVVRQLDRN